jgi:hypothetical protein
MAMNVSAASTSASVNALQRLNWWRHASCLP